MNEEIFEAEIKFLSHFINERRKQKIEKVLQLRTRKICVILEDIYQPQNASAVLRTCDSLGVQDIYVIENRNKYKINPLVTMGVEKWLSLKKFNQKENNTRACIDYIRKKGYQLVATTLKDYNVTLNELPLDRNLAFAFGTEKDGLSDEFIRAADYRMYIPMYGFSQSLNISVSAAITLYTHIQRLLENKKMEYLSREDLLRLKLEWYQKVTGIVRVEI